jgi:hypothetical protein
MGPVFAEGTNQQIWPKGLRLHESPGGDLPSWIDPDYLLSDSDQGFIGCTPRMLPSVGSHPHGGRPTHQQGCDGSFRSAVDSPGLSMIEVSPVRLRGPTALNHVPTVTECAVSAWWPWRRDSMPANSLGKAVRRPGPARPLPFGEQIDPARDESESAVAAVGRQVGATQGNGARGTVGQLPSTADCEKPSVWTALTLPPDLDPRPKHTLALTLDLRDTVGTGGSTSARCPRGLGPPVLEPSLDLGV